MQTDSPRRIPPVLLCALSKHPPRPNQSATNAGHQGRRQERGERQGQQLRGAQLETSTDHLMEDTWGTGAAVKHISTPPKSGYTAWIQAIRHRWILKFYTQIPFSSSIQKTEVSSVLERQNKTVAEW